MAGYGDFADLDRISAPEAELAAGWLREVKSQVEGRVRAAAGAARSLYGCAGRRPGATGRRAAALEDTLRETIERRPASAVVAALAIGWLLGRIGRG